MRIGFIGLGNMGRPMAERLLGSGWDLTVHNRTPAKATSLVEAGARFAPAIADLRGCDVVLSMVGTDDDLRAITLGPGGLFDTPSTGVLLVDCSTVGAEVTEEVASAARTAGGDVLAAPVAGGPSVIPDGGLAIVCSGAPAAYERAEAVLESLARKVIYAGEGATSRQVKILHNLIVAVIAHAVAEVSVLGEAIGVARADLLEFVGAGAIGSPFIRYKAEQMKSLDFSAAFTTALMAKDLDLGHALAAGRADTPLVDHTRATLHDLLAAGWGEQDIAALVAYLAGRNGIDLLPQP
ncbi:NAD(P)-dependent oxidoreductase [Amycolatopsis saalfeldensis]|uniref:3-hydroxyisobutyrate dehydrogenase n=1 Tax=Amycolatopsis saalfeldensis TaxID=394193 RepID=A0A1H8VFF1_9PSEU|nr:NAD(P)-dependent oxidoreductase [Amycolatopsis saalfeldensis]SEP14121.1 3-hydroxyisobutyrate dehydrogenase [Amycolatopsis saalfeldensis]